MDGRGGNEWAVRLRRMDREQQTNSDQQTGRNRWEGKWELMIPPRGPKLGGDKGTAAAKQQPCWNNRQRPGSWTSVGKIGFGWPVDLPHVQERGLGNRPERASRWYHIKRMAAGAEKASDAARAWNDEASVE
ncbi:hypothetical protein M409DRAFT_27295 [Zasmidium cellare ATCC 36951]|uniref:Uncharacterized protein n=1 Tax=Zasmidium cellare ATCC 36951 TaxID=1080233 RepID=A0A6A6C5H0_ZASCE|nr:uncharacterized protein M409DRAFT_27295 [Zasmidium cellare ATCC 36951]KAF2162291.1 hypothetical protein M409DRAFT_27295 [Zasmidium cellare ATCC 36951]